jgi:hypothetical protein
VLASTGALVNYGATLAYRANKYDCDREDSDRYGSEQRAYLISTAGELSGDLVVLDNEAANINVGHLSEGDLRTLADKYLGAIVAIRGPRTIKVESGSSARHHDRRSEQKRDRRCFNHPFFLPSSTQTDVWPAAIIAS